MGLAALTAAAVGSTIAGTVMQAGAARAEGETQGAIYDYNAEVARQNAEAEQYSSAEKAKLMREQMRNTLARNQANVGASGFQFSGTPLDAELAVIDDYAHDIGTVEYNSRVKNAQLQNQAKLFEYQAESARKAGKLGVGQSIIGGVSDLATIGLTYKLVKK